MYCKRTYVIAKCIILQEGASTTTEEGDQHTPPGRHTWALSGRAEMCNVTKPTLASRQPLPTVAQDARLGGGVHRLDTSTLAPRLEHATFACLTPLQR